MNRRNFILHASALSAAMIGFKFLKGFEDSAASETKGFGPLQKLPDKIIEFLVHLNL